LSSKKTVFAILDFQGKIKNQMIYR